MHMVYIIKSVFRILLRFFFLKIRDSYLCIKMSPITIGKVGKFQVKIAKKFSGRHLSGLSKWELKYFKLLIHR